MARAYHSQNPAASARPFRAGRVLGILGALLVTPLIYEGALICMARWRSLFGSAPTPHTPILDTVAEACAAVTGDLQRFAGEHLSTLPIDPNVAVPIGLVLGLLLGMMLMRSR